jgi:DNA-binding transcriptional LysR family regulator
MARPNDPLDTYLLRVLVTLLTERNLTRVAARMNQTQPAISAALRKLRLVFQDELLVRSGNAMVPTPRGVEVLDTARSALNDIDRLFSVGEAFDAQTTQTLFKIGCPDYLSTVFLAGVNQQLRLQAPNARLMVHPLGPGYDFEAALANGELDVVIGNWPEPPEHLHMAPLLDDDIVCLMARNHPLSRGVMTREQYLHAPHIVPLPYSSTHRGVIDKHLASLRVTRNARVIVPFFSMAPHLLSGTDLIFTISRHFADHYAGLLPLMIVPCPIDFPRMRFYQIWHARNQRAAAQQWIRGVLKDVADKMLADRPKSAQPTTKETSK